MSLTIGNDAVEQMVKLLLGLDFGDTIGRVFFYKKNEKYSGNYIVVNHLPFVLRNEVEEGVINVNVHLRRLTSNEPDSKNFPVIVRKIVDEFPPDGRYMGGAWFSFYSNSSPTEDEDDTYFVNLQFTVTYNNLNY